MTNLVERLNFNGFNGSENVLHRTRRWTVERNEAAARIAELEAHNRELIVGIFSGQVREQNLEVRIAELEAALVYIAENAGQTGFKQTATHENATLVCDFAHAALKAKP